MSIGTSTLFQVCCLIGVTLAAQTTCSIPSVKAGGAATLTCNFGDNMQTLRVPFAIRRYKDNVTLEELLTCDWETSVYTCPIRYPQVDFDGKIDTMVSIKLPATRETEGQYICQKQTTPIDNANSCWLRLLTPASASGSSGDEGGTRIGTIVGIIAVLIILGVAGAVLVHWKKEELRARFCHRRNNQDTADRPHGEEDAAVPLSSGPIFKGPPPAENDPTASIAGKNLANSDGVENGAGDRTKTKRHSDKRASRADPKV